MALYFSEGFDSYAASADFALGGWTKINDGSNLYVTIDATGNRWGGPCVRIESRTTQVSMHKTIPVAMSGTLIRFAFWIKTTANMGSGILGGTQIPLFALENGTPDSWLDVKFAPGSLASVTGGGLIITRTENARSGLANYINSELPCSRRINDGRWHHVEFTMTINTTTGTANLWIDGEQQYALTGIDTQDAASNISTYTRVRLSTNQAANVTEYVWFDDVIVWDDSGTEFTGALPNKIHRIDTIRPNGAGNSAQFTPSASTNETNVDETVADDDTTYNESATVGHIDSLAYADMAFNVDEIFGINIRTRAKFDSGSANFRNKMRIASTYYDGATVALAAGYGMVETIFNNNPNNTSNNLTKANIDGSEFGYERVT
jgi:hypothetical protein